MPDSELDPAFPGVSAQLARNWQALSKLYTSRAPVFSGRVSGDDWRPVALACLARGHYAQQSLFRLDDRRLDAAVLARVAFEHIVTYAWMLISPSEHHRMLMKTDYDHVMNMLNDVEIQSGESAALAKLGLVEIAAAAGSVGVPSFERCAKDADEHWAKVLPEHVWDFRTAYANLYRPYSSFVHPRFSGFSVFLDMGPAAVRVNSVPDESRLPEALLGTSTALFIDALTINARVFGWPDAGLLLDVAAAGLGMDETRTSLRLRGERDA